MENSMGFGAEQILTGRGLGLFGFGGGGYGGYGGGYGNLGAGNSFLAAGAHADGTGIGRMVECNGNAQAAQLDSLSRQNEETRRILQNDEVRKDISDFRLQNAVLDGQKDLNFADRLAAMSATNAKCCCDTQLLIVKENSETRELINSRALLDTQRDLDRCLQESQTSQIIAACKCNYAPQTCL